MSARISERRWAIITGLVMLAGLVAAMYLDLPGHLSYDSILQLQQGRTGVYNSWHPPVMAWLLGMGDALLPGAALFVLFDATLCFAAFLSLLAFDRRAPYWPAAVLALALVLTPQFLLYPGDVWKDVLFADASVAGFVCLAHVARFWPRPLLRHCLTAAAFLLLSLAALTRQNGAVAPLLGAAAFGWIAGSRTGRWRDGALSGTAALLVSAVVIVGATLALNTRSDGEPGPSEQFRLLQIYDLAGAVAAEPGLPLSHLSEDEPALATLLRTRLAALYTPARNDPIAAFQPLQEALRTADEDVIAAEWRALVLDHPGLYLKVRLRVFWWLLATPDSAASRPVFVGVEGPAAPMRALGLAPRKDVVDLAFERYAKSFMGTPVFSHLFFAAIAAASLLLMMRRRRPEDVAFAGLLATMFAFTASFVVISISCDYRYLYPLDLAAMASLFYLSLDIHSAIEGKP